MPTPPLPPEPASQGHTPGPFTYWPGGGHGFGIITDKLGRHLAVMVNGAPETEANAKLFASAPALLSALQGLLSRAKFGEPLTLTTEEVDMAKSAVSAATL